MEFVGECFAPLVVHLARIGVAEPPARALEPMDLHSVSAGIGAVLLGDVVLSVLDDAAGASPLAARGNERDRAEVDRLTLKGHFAHERIALVTAVFRAATAGQQKHQ